jgi:hypothetical protein
MPYTVRASPNVGRSSRLMVTPRQPTASRIPATLARDVIPNLSGLSTPAMPADQATIRDPHQAAGGAPWVGTGGELNGARMIGLSTLGH